MKTSQFSRKEIMQWPQGLQVRSIPRTPSQKLFEGIFVFQTLQLQEDDEELFGIMRKGEWITFHVKAGNLELVDPKELANPPLWVVRVEYFKAQKGRPEHFVIRIMDKKEDKVFPVRKHMRELMKDASIKYFQAKVFYDDIELVREVADQDWEKHLIKAMKENENDH